MSFEQSVAHPFFSDTVIGFVLSCDDEKNFSWRVLCMSPGVLRKISSFLYLGLLTQDTLQYSDTCILRETWNRCRISKKMMQKERYKQTGQMRFIDRHVSRETQGRCRMGKRITRKERYKLTT